MLARRTGLKRGKPLRAGRRPYKPAIIRFHHDRVAALGCLVSGQPATLHHPTATIHRGRVSRDDRCVVPLAPQYHQKVFDPKSSDPISIEGLGHAGFHAKYGIDALETGWALWRETEQLWAERFGRGVINGA